MSVATAASDKRRQRGRGLATLSRLRQDIASTFSKQLQTASNPTYNKSEPSIYTERLLSDNRIRVLHIKPSSDPLRQLECELKLVNLDDRSSYEGLSYVWGVDPPSVLILCNNQPLSIRPELSYALTRLRLKDTVRIIWADALCINQNDNKEKSHQVPMMGKIFSQATKVNVWLGHGDGDVIKKAFEVAELIANACRNFSLECGLHLNDRETHNLVNLPWATFAPEVRESLSTLYTRPLFRRVWCIQEIRLARYAEIIWGDQEFPWASVGLSALWIFNKRNWYNVDDDLRISLRQVSIGNVHLTYNSLYGKSLVGLLTQFREFEATDPRDKVYGLVSLLESREEADGLVVDYAKSVAQVFADTGICTINLTGYLEVLAHVQHYSDDKKDNQYIFWAPRWDQPTSAIRIGTYWKNAPKSACNGRKAQILPTQKSERRQLCLTGILFRTVSMLSFVFNKESFERPQESGRLNPFVAVYERIDFSNEDSDKTLHALARTLTVGYLHDMLLLEESGEEGWSELYNSFEDLIGWLRSPTIERKGLGNQVLTLRDIAQKTCWNRRFFWTAQGDFGLGPECMRVGDVVVVLHGGDTPYVLRPRGDKYLFIGEAYVDSIMHGELVELVEEGKRQEQEFCLI